MNDRITLFQKGIFTANSGEILAHKVECDALLEEDIETIAWRVGSNFHFKRVIGIPRGGKRLADALQKYARRTGPFLIVDDVLTTGGSMEHMRVVLGRAGYTDVTGVVIFARKSPPPWIYACWTAAPWW